MRSLAVGQQRERPGLARRARSSNRGTVKLSFPRSRRYRPFHRNQGKRAVVPRGPWTTLLPTRSRMRYPVFRAQGMHLGSGIAEAACKTIVSTRAKRVFHALDA